MNRLSKILKSLNRPIFIFPVLIIAYCVFALKDCNGRAELIRHYSIANGTIIHFSPGSRISNDIKYSFEVNGKSYIGHDAYPYIKSSMGEDLVGYHFPVAFQVGDTNNNTMLIAPVDFDVFHRAFPDSLLWVKKYLSSY